MRSQPEPVNAPLIFLTANHAQTFANECMASDA
jgi:hypothetical protein